MYNTPENTRFIEDWIHDVQNWKDDIFPANRQELFELLQYVNHTQTSTLDEIIDLKNEVNDLQDDISTLEHERDVLEDRVNEQKEYISELEGKINW